MRKPSDCNNDTLNERRTESAMNQQVGGYHYKKYPIQPMEYAFKNRLDHLQFSVVKYVTRFRDKKGREDLEKAKHCIDMLIEMEYGENGK